MHLVFAVALVVLSSPKESAGGRGDALIGPVPVIVNWAKGRAPQIFVQRDADSKAGLPAPPPASR